MALVDYASSDEDIEGLEDVQTTSLKRKRDDESLPDLPPLPSKFHDLYASTTRVSTRDDPSLHGGRTRVSPHIEGNWPTHLYIEWYSSNAEHESLTALISTLQKKISSENLTSHLNSFLISELGAPLPLHISLSRPIGFTTGKRDAFVTSLEAVVKSSGIRPFNLSFSGLRWVSNIEKTRWFLVLGLQKPELNGLNKLLHVSNIVVQEYGQPPLYSPPSLFQENKARGYTQSRTHGKKAVRSDLESKIDWNEMQNSDAFHISIAWSLESPSLHLLESTKSLMIDGLEKVKKITIRVEEFKAKVGNVVTNIPLARTMVDATSLFGF